MMKLLKKLSGKSIAAILLLTVLVSFCINFRDRLPTWNDIYMAAGTADQGLASSNSEIRVTFFDVGNADCAWINTKSFNMIIDSGAPTYASEIVKTLKHSRIKTIDMAVISHADSDHVGNMLEILKNFNVKLLVAPKCEDIDFESYTIYNDIINYANSNSIAVEYAELGDSYSYGEVNITVLAPAEQFNDVNNNSLMMKIAYNGSSFLFTGDMEKRAQMSILSKKIDISADVVKIPHHGRKSSYCEEFIKAVKPQTAVISCGDLTEYRVSYELLDFLESEGINCLRTDTKGNITIITTGNSNYDIIIENNN